MGGRSSSKQSTTSKNSNTNIVNDGEFAGAGDVTIDESEHSIEDSYNRDNSVSLEDSGNVDNSNAYEDSFNTDESITNEYEDSFNTDNSLTNEYEDSFNTDNSIENDGAYAGNHGTITLSDGGAISAANDIAKYALSNNESALESAFDFGSNALEFGRDALDEVQTIATSSMGNVSAFGRDALNENGKITQSAFEFGRHALDNVGEQAIGFSDNLTQFGSAAIDSVSEQAMGFSDNLQMMLESSQQSNQSILENSAKSNSTDKALMAELARSTSLAGQDLVAKSSEKMTMYMALALGVGFIAIIVFGSRE